MINDLQETSGTSTDTPVVHGERSLAFHRCCNSLAYAQIRFLNTVRKFAGGQTDHRRRLVGRRLDDITKAIRRCDAFAGKPSGAKREQDILACFLIQQAVPFVEFWREAIEAVDKGVSLQVKWRDIPVWLWEMPT